MSGNLLCNRALVTAKQTEIKPKQQQIHPRTGKVDGKKKGRKTNNNKKQPQKPVSLCIIEKVANYKCYGFGCSFEKHNKINFALDFNIFLAIQ